MFSRCHSRQRKCLLLMALGWTAAVTLCAYGRWEYRQWPLGDKDPLQGAVRIGPPDIDTSKWGVVPTDSESAASKRDEENAQADQVLDECVIAIGILCSIPWLWYFLLRRLAEVSAAIRGDD
jgi:hypothetical protein